MHRLEHVPGCTCEVSRRSDVRSMRSIHLFCVYFFFIFLTSYTTPRIRVCWSIVLLFFILQTASVARFYLSLFFYSAISPAWIHTIRIYQDEYARWELLVPKVVIAGDINRLHSLAGIGILRLIPIVSWFADLNF